LAQSYQYQALWWGVSLVRLCSTGESTALFMGAIHGRYSWAQPCTGVQPANSQCQASGSTPAGSAQAGWNRP
jgi:hypothetical protein